MSIKSECCWRCWEERQKVEGEDGVTLGNVFFPTPTMIVCRICGNKRCPKAEDHRYRCTHSNEPNQVKELETMTTDEQRERDMRRAMQHMASRKPTYWGFVYNFRQWKWGKAGHLVVGLLITAAFVAWGIAAPGWSKALAWAMLAGIHWAHWRNYKGKQA